ncbi:hypothetical protein Tco_1459484 [Tanacetum coccineum]
MHISPHAPPSFPENYTFSLPSLHTDHMTHVLVNFPCTSDFDQNDLEDIAVQLRRPASRVDGWPAGQLESRWRPAGQMEASRIILPSPVPFEELLNDFMNSPNVFEMDELESDNEYIDTPLVSPFIDSDEELDDEEVLNELNEYGNAGNFYRNKWINCIDGCDLAFPLLKV